MPHDQALTKTVAAPEGPTLLADVVREAGATEVARVRNLAFDFAPAALYPLAPTLTGRLDRIAAFAVDMDGTSTTTEPLALGALEYMVRRVTGRLTEAEWPGLDERLDVPFVIGNSNFRHAEFLLERYRDALDPAALRTAFFEALLWTLAALPDESRRREIRQTARNCGLGPLLADATFAQVVAEAPISFETAARHAAPLLDRFGHLFTCDHAGASVAAALDIYYFRYHALLGALRHGGPSSGGHDAIVAPIAPMPGYAVFVPLVKGWLGAEADALATVVLDQLTPHAPRPALSAARAELGRLGAHFERNPARLALVTASIRYEAEAVMDMVLQRIAAAARTWPVSASTADSLAQRLSRRESVFDAFVSASDAHENRLKPHPDLYTIALHRMSVPREDYRFCIGLEDTEPGIIALRAAGIGCAVALPNGDTRAQGYQAAARVIDGGLPELLLTHGLLLNEDVSR